MSETASPTVEDKAQAWAPGALPMLWWTVAFLGLLAVMNVVGAFVHREPPFWMPALAVAWLVPAILSHVYYVQAKRALEADAALRGRGLVRHLWWFVLLVLFLGWIVAAVIMFVV